MPDGYASEVQMLLALKGKEARGVRWTRDDKTAVTECFEKGGMISILAACCVLCSKRRQGRRRSLAIVRQAIERVILPPYVELSLYEGLLFVRVAELAPFLDSILFFIEQSLLRRAIDLTNTINLLSRMAQSGEARAVALLRSLAVDEDAQVRSNASLVLDRLQGKADRS